MGTKPKIMLQFFLVFQVLESLLIDILVQVSKSHQYTIGLKTNINNRKAFHWKLHCNLSLSNAYNTWTMRITKIKFMS